VINRYVGNPPPMPGVFPDYPGPVVRNTDSGRALTKMRWGMPPPPRTGGPPVTNIRNTSSPDWRGAKTAEPTKVVDVMFGSAEEHTMRLVHQNDEDGCGIACVAMAAGTTYKKARDNLPKYWESKGTTKKQMIRGLHRYGIATGKPTSIKAT